MPVRRLLAMLIVLTATGAGAVIVTAAGDTPPATTKVAIPPIAGEPVPAHGGQPTTTPPSTRTAAPARRYQAPTVTVRPAAPTRQAPATAVTETASATPETATDPSTSPQPVAPEPSQATTAPAQTPPAPTPTSAAGTPAPASSPTGGPVMPDDPRLQIYEEMVAKYGAPIPETPTPALTLVPSPVPRQTFNVDGDTYTRVPAREFPAGDPDTQAAG
jgi:hypothetical protein